jgi:hypothetical protein
MFSEMGTYYEMLSKSRNKTLFETVKSLAGNFMQEASIMTKEIDGLVQQRHIADVLGEQVMKDGKVKTQREQGYYTNALLSLGDQQNPFLRALNELKIENENSVNRQLETFMKDWAKVNNETNAWIRTNGRNKFLEMLVNKETGNLIAHFSPEFNEAFKDAQRNKEYDWIKKYYEPVFTEEEFKKNREEFEQKLVLQGLDSDKVEAKLKKYDENHDLWNSDKAWLNRKIIRIKESTYENERWMSDKRKAIVGTPLEDFYKFYRKSMGKFLSMVDKKREREGSNFIPWIRQELVEVFMSNGSDITKSIRETLLNSISQRTDSSYFTGDINKLDMEVPVYFMDRPLDDNGNPIPGEEKSMDLMNSLLTFGKMAIAHRASKKTVGIANMIVEAYANSTVYETTPMGSLKRVGSQFAERPLTDFEKETARAFRDYYWYGIEMRSKDYVVDIGGKKISLIETGRMLKNRWTMMTLSFGLKQALGGYVSAKVNAWTEGSKGVYYNSKQFINATRLFYKEHEKTMALGMFMDIYTEDVIERKLRAQGLDPHDVKEFQKESFVRTFKDQRYAEWWRNFNIDRIGMGFWQYEAESRDNALVVAASQNFGINGNNEFVRFREGDFEADGVTLKEEKRSQGFRQMYEIFSYDSENGPRFNVDNMTDAEKHKLYLRFREALKRIRSGISGEVSAEEKSYVSMTIMGQLLMQYRSWMPGVIRERFGQLTYENRTLSAHQGRYKVFFKHLFQDTSKKDIQFTNLMLTGMARLGRILAEAAYIPSAYRSLMGKEKKFTPDMQRIKLEYDVWKENNPDIAEQISLEDYAEMRVSQLTAMINEVRMIFLHASLLLMLAAWMKEDEDDEDEYALRFGYSILRKSYAELTFMLNPLEYSRMTKNAVPLASLPENMFKATTNTFDELRDIIFGENSPYDKAGWFHYSKKFVPLFPNISRIMEWSKEDEKYLQQGLLAPMA